MGLCMYIYQSPNAPTTKANSRDAPFLNEDYGFDWDRVPQEIKDKCYDQSGDIELCYWRKHPDLHRWFENLYRDHNGKPYDDHDYDQYNDPNTLFCTECDKKILECKCAWRNEDGSTNEQIWAARFECSDDACDLDNEIYFNDQSIEIDIQDIVKLQPSHRISHFTSKYRRLYVRRITLRQT